MTHIPPFEPDPGLYPFTSRWFDSRAGRVHYIDEGEGRPILFLHGNPTWSFLYRGIVIRLRKQYRCIAVDYPGFGLSERPDDYGYTPREHAEIVVDLVRELDLDDLTIMGQDWGGPIGMKVALDEIDRLRALVMGNTWYWPVDTLTMKTFGYVMSSAPLQSLILNRNFFVERLVPWGAKHDVAPEVMDHYRDAQPTPTDRVGVAEMPRQLLRSAFWLGELAHAVPRMLRNVPLLLTWGIHDFAFTTAYMDRFREDFSLVKVKRLDAKHYIQEDAPAEIAAAIDEFLSEQEVAALGPAKDGDAVEGEDARDAPDGKDGTDGTDGADEAAGSGGAGSGGAEGTGDAGTDEEAGVPASDADVSGGEPSADAPEPSRPR